MKFRIANDAYERGAAARGVIPLRVKASGRMLFIKEEAGPLLDTDGAWTEFSGFAASADDALRRDFQDALTALNCFGVAERVEEAPDTHKGCRVAGERDYEGIAAFIQGHANAGFGFALAGAPGYYSQDSVRSRQFNNYEYHFLKERDGRLLCVLVVSVPTPEQVISVATVQSAVFDSALSEADCRECLRDALDFAAFAFSNEFNKMRFLYTGPRQDWLLKELEGYGFAKTCTLPKEILNQIDLTIYDRFMD